MQKVLASLRLLRDLAGEPYSCTLAMSMVKPTILCVLGPTSSGKTALGIRLAKRFFGEIINADARQLYRDAPIGTGVPRGYVAQESGEGLVEGVRHHLFALSAPDQVWTVSEWRKAAEHRIKAVLERGHLPMVVGGTGMYVRALAEGFVFSGAPDPARRASLLALSPEERVEALLKIVPEAERMIDLANSHRVLRALERVLEGQSLQPTRIPPPYEYRKLARWYSPEALRARIEHTIQRQFDEGWEAEVRLLLERGVPQTSALMQSIGFRTMATALVNGEPSAHVQQAIVAETWAYARRQMTWLRKEPGLHWIHTDDEAETLVEQWLTK